MLPVILQLRTQTVLFSLGQVLEAFNLFSVCVMELRNCQIFTCMIVKSEVRRCDERPYRLPCDDLIPHAGRRCTD